MGCHGSLGAILVGDLEAGGEPLRLLFKYVRRLRRCENKPEGFLTHRKSLFVHLSGKSINAINQGTGSGAEGMPIPNGFHSYWRLFFIYVALPCKMKCCAGQIADCHPSHLL